MSHRHPLLLLGAGGLGREIAQAVTDMSTEDSGWELLGFLDDREDLHGAVISGHRVLGPLAAIADYPDALVIASTGRGRQAIVSRLPLEHDRWATVVHPSATIPDSVEVGAGSVVLAHAVATCDVRIGRHAVLMPAVTLTHDVVVEDYVTLASGAQVAGRARLAEGSYVGSGALIRQDVIIGARSTVGMGAVVTRDVPACETWIGNPARRIARPDDSQVPLVDLVAAHAELADEIMPAVNDVIARAAFIGGPEVAEFEASYAAFSGAERCIGVANGTDALEVALRALGVARDDEVIVPANSFAATAEAVMRAGAVPVFADVDDDGLLDCDSAEAAVTMRTAAIIPVHLYGQLADMEAITRLAQRHSLELVEDAAQCQGATRNGKPAGSWGRMAATSFYPGKNLGAYGDAGAIVTNDGALADRARLIANHGSRRRYHHDEPGFNSRLDTVQAAVLLARLRHLSEWNERRRRAAAYYGDLLAGVDGLVLPREVPGNTHVWHLYVVQVDERDRVLAELTAAGIGAAIHYPIPLHLQPAFPPSSRSLPTAERLAERILSLPIGPHITRGQQERVAEALEKALV